MLYNCGEDFMLVFLQCARFVVERERERELHKCRKKGSKIKFNYLPVGFKVRQRRRLHITQVCRRSIRSYSVARPDEQKINCNHEEYYVVTAQGERNTETFSLL